MSSKAHDGLGDRIRGWKSYLRDRSSAIEAAQKPWEAATTKAEPAQWAPAGEVSLDLKANDGAVVCARTRGPAPFRSTAKAYLNGGDAAAFDIDDRFTFPPGSIRIPRPTAAS